MNLNVDVIATFNALGEMKPLFVRLEDEQHVLQTYRIERINQVKEEKVSGISSLQYVCVYEAEGMEKQMILRYHFLSHKWCCVG